jgi:tetratricopeptide (TPR) repeat protein
VAGLALGLSGEERRAYLAWSSFVPFYAVGVALFFVGERYRLPLFVPLCVTSAGALDWMLRASRKPASISQPPTSISQPPTSARAAGLVTLAAAAVLTFWPFHLDSGRFAERLRLSKVLMNRGDFGQAAMELEKASRLEPGDTTVEFNLGMALVAQGRAQEGLAHVRRAVDAGVPIKGARYALAGALQATGDSAGAASLLRTFSPLPDEDAESCYQVALVAIDAQAPDVAERYLKRAIALRPDYTEAKQELARLQNSR